MASKITLNAKNLEALGIKRLAELLIEISTGSAARKRRLRMELAGNHSSAEMAREVRKRLISIARARTFINRGKVKALKTDLETQRLTIVDTLAADDPAEAFELIWQFLALADSVFARSDDGSGSLIESFHQACTDAGTIARLARAAPDLLADKIFAALQDNGYGQYDGLITVMVPVLGKEGVDRLKTRFEQWLVEPHETPSQHDRQVIHGGINGSICENEIYNDRRELTVRVALQEIADALGDVDAYIVQQPETTRTSPMVAADIANRLLGAGRAEEALHALDQTETGRTDLPFEWQLAQVETLEALKRGDEAQAYRWKCFEESLNDEHLRAFLRRLPDFDDIEAEEKAHCHAQAFPDVHRSLMFFLRWPSPAEATQLVTARQAELDGDRYELIMPAAEALQEKHPLAATILLRSMIDFALDRARSSRYKHAARHLAECQVLSAQIGDLGNLPSHDEYVVELRRQHGRKQGFWSRVGST